MQVNLVNLPKIITSENSGAATTDLENSGAATSLICVASNRFEIIQSRANHNHEIFQ